MRFLSQAALLLVLLLVLTEQAACRSPLSSRQRYNDRLNAPRLSAASPSCALNGPAGTCPPPLWAPQWNLTLSTVCQPSSDGYFVPPASEPWGLVSLDWSVAMSVWKKPNQNLSTVEATSVYGCRLIKAASPGTRCFIYHNMELALQALESQRLIMYDPRYADFFLQYQDAAGRKTGRIYNEVGGPGDQFFWDFRVAAARDYYMYSVLTTVSDPAVDGTFTDDLNGFPAEHGDGPKNINMSDADVAQVQYYTAVAHQQLVQELIQRGKYNWQAFAGASQDFVGDGISQATCAAFMRARCTAAYQSNTAAITMSFDINNEEQSLAAFLITRPPIAYLGYGWESDQSLWRPIFLTQVGEPGGNCAESPVGIFSRPWTYGTVQLDCNKWNATIPHA